jgi:hypothetical protein
MSYRPITDMWILARAKLKGSEKYYGAYLGGFPERARALLGVTLNDPVLHVCGGKAKLYPYRRGFGPNDKTLDLDPLLQPDFHRDAREVIPRQGCQSAMPELCNCDGKPWPAILADPPYSEEDADKYTVGRAAYPKPNLLLKNCIDAVRPGGRVGMIHYLLPDPPANAHFVACIGVVCGFNNRMRCFSVFERTD